MNATNQLDSSATAEETEVKIKTEKARRRACIESVREEIEGCSDEELERLESIVAHEAHARSAAGKGEKAGYRAAHQGYDDTCAAFATASASLDFVAAAIRPIVSKSYKGIIQGEGQRSGVRLIGALRVATVRHTMHVRVFSDIHELEISVEIRDPQRVVITQCRKRRWLRPGTYGAVSGSSPQKAVDSFARAWAEFTA